MTIRITGTGSALPEKTVTNFDLQELVETSDEWIQKRTGIAQRRISTGETVAMLAAQACKKALEMAEKTAAEVDLILVATCSPELLLPCCACQVQDLIGASNAVAFDLNAACSGFLFALNTAQVYLQSGVYKNALVIGSEVLSKLVDWNDRGTCILKPLVHPSEYKNFLSFLQKKTHCSQRVLHTKAPFLLCHQNLVPCTPFQNYVHFHKDSAHL